jgi:hypothetical protein
MMWIMVDESDNGGGMALAVASKPAVAREPGEGSLEDPALGQEDEAVCLGEFDDLDLPWPDRATRGPGIGVGEELGDRGKEAFGVAQQATDWGNMIAGHGGILDRLDSVIFAAPIFFHVTRYWWTS